MSVHEKYRISHFTKSHQGKRTVLGQQTKKKNVNVKSPSVGVFCCTFWEIMLVLVVQCNL